WMKNMRFPLDFIWIDSEKKIVEITQNVPICTVDNCPVYSASVPIRYVLEVPAGFVKRYGISEGDTVTISP
ncbi:MAG: DUF192 domain-containing protein, partial [Candidatus Omnitrophica bacterium]|nr:DUF192 domain-containing protein [Candidatus Omnitrophota bacterium]